MVGQKTIEAFLEVLSSKQPVPGDGGASVLAGALGNALGRVVGNLIIGKKKYADVEEEIQEPLSRMEKMQAQFVALADRDAEVSAPLAQCYSLPSVTPEEKAYKEKVMEERLLDASCVPLEIMGQVVEILDILEVPGGEGGRLATSDVGVGVQFIRTAVLGAVMNVYINTKSTKNRDEAEDLNARAERLIKEGTARADRIYAGVLEQLKWETVKCRHVLERTVGNRKETTMEMLKGAEVPAKIKERAAQMLSRLGEYVPKLAIVRVGERPDDVSYERGVTKKMESFGLRVQFYVFPEDVSDQGFKQGFHKINRDEDVTGILLLRPLPKQIVEADIEKVIDPSKDLDGISPSNTAKVFAGDSTGFAPCTVEAVIEVLKANNIPVTGKRMTVVGRSMVVDRPLSMLMLKENATVTVCHTRTRELEATCRDGEILVATAGRTKMLDDRYVDRDAVVIDVGINVDENGKLCGDVDFDSISETASMATSVPGGVGAVTATVLAKHLLCAALHRAGLEG